MTDCICNINGVPGAAWITNTDTGKLEIQRCDSCAIFDSDMDALDAVLKNANYIGEDND